MTEMLILLLFPALMAYAACSDLVSMTIQPGQEIIVGQRLREILGAAQKGKSAA